MKSIQKNTPPQLDTLPGVKNILLVAIKVAGTLVDSVLPEIGIKAWKGCSRLKDEMNGQVWTLTDNKLYNVFRPLALWSGAEGGIVGLDELLVITTFDFSAEFQRIKKKITSVRRFHHSFCSGWFETPLLVLYLGWLPRARADRPWWTWHETRWGD